MECKKRTFCRARKQSAHSWEIWLLGNIARAENWEKFLLFTLTSMSRRTPEAVRVILITMNKTEEQSQNAFQWVFGVCFLSLQIYEWTWIFSSEAIFHSVVGGYGLLGGWTFRNPWWCRRINGAISQDSSIDIPAAERWSLEIFSTLVCTCDSHVECLTSQHHCWLSIAWLYKCCVWLFQSMAPVNTTWISAFFAEWRKKYVFRFWLNWNTQKGTTGFFLTLSIPILV